MHAKHLNVPEGVNVKDKRVRAASAKRVARLNGRGGVE